MSTAPQPFGFHRLPRLRRLDVELAAAMQQKLPPWGRLSATLERAIATPVVGGVATVGAVEPERVAASLTAGWMGALVDTHGRCAGVAHVDAPLVQAIAARLLGQKPAPLEVRPLLPVEEETMSLLFGVLLSEAGVPLVGRSAGPEALEGLDAPQIGRAMCHLRVDESGGFVTLWAIPSRWPERSPAQRAAERRRRLERSPLRDGWSLEARVRLARFEGSHRELCDLGVGDVLLPGEWRGLSAPSRGALCLAGRSAATVALDWSRRVECRVVDPSRGGGPALKDSDELTRRTLEQMRPVTSERVEPLEIVVGSTRLPLGTLLEIEPGRVFTLDVPVDAPVELLLDGRRIGRGELVEVGGRLGVRITAISR